MYLKNYFFLNVLIVLKKIFKLSLKFLVLNLTDVKREGERGIRERKGWSEKGRGEREGERLILALV